MSNVKLLFCSSYQRFNELIPDLKIEIAVAEAVTNGFGFDSLHGPGTG